MRRVGVWVAVVLVAAGLGGLLHGQKWARAEAGCLPDGYRPVTVLARPGLGHSFLKLETAGEATAYLDGGTGRVMVPVRSLVTLMTPAHQVATWDEATRTATFIRGDRRIAFTFPPGSAHTDTAVVNGQPARAAAVLCGGKVVASARLVAGALGSGIKWYQGNTVVVDPAWEPDAETLALLAAAGAKPGGPSRESLADAGGVGSGAPELPRHGECEAYPSRAVDFLLAPADSSRRLAHAVACQMLIP